MVAIRRAELADADAIWRVHTRSIRALARDHYRPDQIDAWVAGLRPSLYHPLIADQRIWVTEQGAPLSAFVQLNARTGELEGLYVAPDHTGQGLGRRLVRFAEAQARQAGHVQIHLSAAANAVAFYAHLGYRAVGRTTHCLPAGGQLECTDMQRGLPQDPALRDKEPP